MAKINKEIIDFAEDDFRKNKEKKLNQEKEQDSGKNKKDNK